MDKLFSLQAYRAIASVLVVIYHTYQMNYFNDTYFSIFKFAHSGVELFFVLSGFIILYIHIADINMGWQKTIFYLKKRILRIYPIYWFVLLFFAIPYGVFFGDTSLKTGMSIINSIFLFPQIKPHLMVSWTLSYEMLFYLIFSLLILHKQFGIFVFFVWFIFICISQVLNYDFFIISSQYNVLFFIGLIACYLITNNLTPTLYTFGIGVSLFFLTAFLDNLNLFTNYLVYLYGISAFFILLSSKNSYLNNISNQRVLQLIGNASFSIYLSHYLIIRMLSKILDFMKLNHYDMLLWGGVYYRYNNFYLSNSFSNTSRYFYV